MKISLPILIITLLVGINASAQIQKLHTLIVVFDGLRPDYITPELMPNVYALKQAGAYGNRHHSVFPTVTRVNASSYATGSYPAHHGIMGNTIYLPQVDATHTLSTGDAESMMHAADALHGHLLTAISLGEILEQQGERFMVFSSGSTGQAFFQNHKASNGVIVNPELITPEAMKAEVERALGYPPAETTPNTARHAWVTDALLHYALKADGPAAAAIWYSDPDGAAHETGMGTEITNASIRSVDQQFGRILEALKTRGLENAFNIVITADHGFVTYAGKEDLGNFLIAQGLKQSKDSDDVILAGGAIYVKGHDADKIRKIVATLQQQEWVGAIFTEKKVDSQRSTVQGKQPEDLGWVDGTLSFESIHWNHGERAADILVDVNWNDAKNEHGYAGTSFSKGVAGHGSASPYEIHIPLIAAGPSFRTRYLSDVPTSNVDLVPTLLKIHGIPVPAEMDGRVMEELFRASKPAKINIKTETVETRQDYAGGSYTILLERTTVGKYKYVNFTRVERHK